MKYLKSRLVKRAVIALSLVFCSLINLDVTTYAAAGDLEISIDTNLSSVASTSSTQFKVFIDAGSANIDWGDGNSDVGISGEYTHTYAAAGTYTVAINGATAVRFYDIAANSDEVKITSIDQWGTTTWTSTSEMFKSATNMTYAAGDTPDLSATTDMSEMFYGASLFNADLSSWDVSNVTDMSGLFGTATAFNGNISNWDTSSVTDMSNMFFAASVFNQDISLWDTSSVTDMSSMFASASVFNQSLATWDVSSVTNMNSMFLRAFDFDQDISLWNVSSVTQMNQMFRLAYDFNQNISAWDVSSVTDMSEMFDSARLFNQNISAWDVSSVTDMSEMFADARAFNQDLSAWDVSSVTDMSDMFRSADVFNGDLTGWNTRRVTNMESMFDQAPLFNGDVSDWDTSSVTDMASMFSRASVFNQDLTSWDVSSVTDMYEMFDSATLFNGDISDWDTSSVTDMYAMFNDATAFNQDISTWDYSQVLDMEDFLVDAPAFSTLNYDRLLDSLSDQTLQDSIYFYVDAEYCATAAERTSIIDTYSWDIEDGGLAGGLCEFNAPTVSAGADKEITASSTTINGSATDRNGTVTSYAWTQVSGPNTALLEKTTTTTLVALGLIEGVYVFQLAATDNDTQTGSDTVQVTVGDQQTSSGGSRRKASEDGEEEVSDQPEEEIVSEVVEETQVFEEVFEKNIFGCNPVFTEFVVPGDQNSEVALWQRFLNFGFNESIPETGFFGDLTGSAVSRFQEFFTGAILTPWGLTEGTGTVFQTTRSWANRITGCTEAPFEIEGNIIDHGTYAIPRGYEFLQDFQSSSQSEVNDKQEILEADDMSLNEVITSSVEVDNIEDQDEINMLLKSINLITDQIEFINSI